MILVVDNFDSFTYNLVDYLHQLDLKVHIERNNAPIKMLCSPKYAGIVLSPGPGIPKNAGNLIEIIAYYHSKKPMLGICLGHQAINTFFGGEIAKAEKPMHGKLSTVHHNGSDIFQNVPESFDAVRYHSLVCNRVSHNLDVTAKTAEAEVMALKHKSLPVYGLQFHPEAVLTVYGLKILENWKNINSLSN